MSGKIKPPKLKLNLDLPALNVGVELSQTQFELRPNELSTLLAKAQYTVQYIATVPIVQGKVKRDIFVKISRKTWSSQEIFVTISST